MKGDAQIDQFKIKFNSYVHCFPSHLSTEVRKLWLMCSFLLTKGQRWTWGILCSLSPKPVMAMLASRHSKTPRLTDVLLKCENKVIDDGSHAAVYQKEKFSWTKKKSPVKILVYMICVGREYGVLVFENSHWFFRPQEIIRVSLVPKPWYFHNFKTMCLK